LLGGLSLGLLVAFALKWIFLPFGKELRHLVERFSCKVSGHLSCSRNEVSILHFLFSCFYPVAFCLAVASHPPANFAKNFEIFFIKLCGVFATKTFGKRGYLQGGTLFSGFLPLYRKREREKSLKIFEIFFTKSGGGAKRRPIKNAPLGAARRHAYQS
jgi:hypothetical protein